MAEALIGLTQGAFQQVARVVRQVNSTAPPLPRVKRRIPIGNPWYWAKVSSGSSITVGTFSAPTPFLFDIWLTDFSSGSTPQPLIVSTDPNQLGMPGGNYMNVTAPAGRQIKVEFKDNVWSLKWVDCP